MSENAFTYGALGAFTSLGVSWATNNMKARLIPNDACANTQALAFPVGAGAYALAQYLEIPTPDTADVLSFAAGGTITTIALPKGVDSLKDLGK